MHEVLARDRRIVEQLAGNHFAQIFMPRQFAGDVVAVGQVADVAHAVGQDHPLEALVGFRVLDDRKERRKPGAGGKQVQVAPRVQVRDQQGAGGLAPEQDLVAGLEVLQARGERAVLDLDGEELHFLFPVGAGDRIGAQQRLAVHRQADHHELAVLEAQAGTARGAEAEVVGRPVADVQHAFDIERGHGALHQRKRPGSAAGPCKLSCTAARRFERNQTGPRSRRKIQSPTCA